MFVIIEIILIKHYKLLQLLKPLKLVLPSTIVELISDDGRVDVMSLYLCTYNLNNVRC